VRESILKYEVNLVKAILSADLNWGIGCGGKLLKRVPEDMKFFRNMTANKVVVMGRDTFESFPGMQPLKDRVNIVLSKNEHFNRDNLIVCRSIDDLTNKLSGYQSEDVYVIGGESVYTQLLPYCSEVYITLFETVFTADRHFPDLDAMENWKRVSESEQHFFEGLSFKYLKYENCAVIDF
jgi:dihydrofolate reductase